MRLFPALLMLVLVTGCTSTRTLTPDADGLARVNRTYEARPARLMLASGQYVHARALRLDADSTTWVEPTTGTLQRAATADVVYVERICCGRGAWQGAALAAAATTVVMSAVVAADLQDRDWGSCGGTTFIDNCDKPLFAVMMGTVFGATATVPGAVGGAVVGSRDRTTLVPTVVVPAAGSTTATTAGAPRRGRSDGKPANPARGPA